MDNQIEYLEELVDDLRDKVHDLTIDLRQAQRDLDSATDTNAQLEEDISHVDKENFRLSDQLEKVEQKYEDTVEFLKMRLMQMEGFANEKVRDEIALERNYLKVLAMVETIRNGNEMWFKSQSGREFIEWARTEFDRMTTQRKGMK